MARGDDLVVVDDPDDTGQADHGEIAAVADRMKRQMAGAPVGGRPPPAPAADPVERVKSFSVDHLDGRGRRWRGDFASHILSVRERIQVGALRATLLAGAPSAAVDEYTADLVEMVAHLSFSLDRRPPWFEDPGKLDDPDVVVAVYREVAAHEVAFRSPPGGRSAGAPGAPDAPLAPAAVVGGEVPPAAE